MIRGRSNFPYLASNRRLFGSMNSLRSIQSQISPTLSLPRLQLKTSHSHSLAPTFGHLLSPLSQKFSLPFHIPPHTYYNYLQELARRIAVQELISLQDCMFSTQTRKFRVRLWQVVTPAYQQTNILRMRHQIPAYLFIQRGRLESFILLPPIHFRFSPIKKFTLFDQGTGLVFALPQVDSIIHA